MTRVLALVVLIVAGCAAPCAAHPATIARGVLTVERDGRFSLNVRCDLLAFALNDTPLSVRDEPMHALLDGPVEELCAALDVARRRMERGLRLQSSLGTPSVAMAESPTVEHVRAAAPPDRTARLPVMGDFVATGRLPPGKGTLAVRFPAVLDTMLLVVERPGVDAVGEPVPAGDFSAPIDVETSGPALPTTAPAAIEDEPSGDFGEAGWRGFRYWFGQGFVHILPKGLDHILFVVGLFLLDARQRPLLWQVTAFTVAHSITLALAAYDVVRVPSEIVEPLIALSIAFVAIENVFTKKLHPWRPAVVFAFGLLHGLGFASVMRELPLPAGGMLRALLGFNLGVEAGQLATVVFAFGLVGWGREEKWYRARVVIPASVAIALVALYWTWERTVGA